MPMKRKVWMRESVCGGCMMVRPVLIADTVVDFYDNNYIIEHG